MTAEPRYQLITPAEGDRLARQLVAAEIVRVRNRSRRRQSSPSLPQITATAHAAAVRVLTAHGLTRDRAEAVADALVITGRMHESLAVQRALRS